MFKHLYPSSPMLQMLTSKMLAHDRKKRVTILYVFNTLQSCMVVDQELNSSLSSTSFITKTLDFIISFGLHLVYQAACYITGILSLCTRFL